MRNILVIALLSLIGLIPQDGRISPGFNKGTSSSTISVYEGGLIGGESITNNALRMLAVPFTTTADTGQSASACNFLVTAPATANWGCAIYNDSSGPSTLVTNCAAFTSSAPGASMGTLALSGCNLSASTKYWATYVTASSSQGFWRDNEACQSGIGQSVFQIGTLGSFTSVASWPGTFPAFTAENKCYDIFATVQFNSASSYVFVATALSGACNTTSCTFHIPTTGSNQALYVGYGARDSTVSSITDSASDTIPLRGTCVGIGTSQVCIASIDRVSSGVTTINLTDSTSGAEITLSYALVTGTASSSSFDQSEYDTSAKATPFTSGATGATTQANELLIGLASNAGLNSGTFTGTSGWSVLAQGVTINTPVQPTALMFKTVSSTGTQTLNGTFSLGGTTNVLGLATFK